MGIAAAAVSRNIDLNGMNMMYDDSHNFIGEMMKFFDGTVGMVVLLASFASMIVGMWYMRKTKLIPIAAIGAVFMFAGMYHTYSLGLQIFGVTIMAFTYLPMYSFRVSKTLRL
jgi:uncharacterized membrane protein